jgi:hypothetical protein
MKTELEEAAEKYLQEWRLVNNIHLSNPIHAERCKNDFKAGGNYLAERMYSEEEVYSLLEQSIKDCHLWELEEHYSGDYKNLKEWFKQYKKK